MDTACQFVRGLGLWRPYEWVGVLKDKMGIRGIRALQAMGYADPEQTLRRLESFIVETDNCTVAEALVIVTAFKNVVARQVVSD